MKQESARPGALPHSRQHHRSPLAGRAVAHLQNGHTYCGWIEIGGGVVTIHGRLRTTTGPSPRGHYSYRKVVRRTYPARAIKRIDWLEASQ
jgi:hypothetical protein